MEPTAQRQYIGSTPLAFVGEEICTGEFLKGFNTYLNPATGCVHAATCGAVEVVEKVVSVRGLHRRYIAEIGDVVVGRVLDVSGNRWKVDIGSLCGAILLLMNVTEPGGVLRRRGREDEVTMRAMFAEGDVVIAEVQRILHDGTISLHVRSAEKYGKVRSHGQLVTVTPSLMRRNRRHFVVLVFCGVAAVLGRNGQIWLSVATPAQLAEALMAREAETAEASGGEEEPLPPEFSEGPEEEMRPVSENDLQDTARMQQNVARIRNIILILNDARMAIDVSTITATFRVSMQLRLPPFEILLERNREELLRVASAFCRGGKRRRTTR